MTKQQSFSLTARLSGVISATNPVYDFSAKKVREAKKEYSDEEILALEKMGWLCGDFELFLVVSRFLSDNGIFDIADDDYITAVFKNARKLSVSQFYEDPYIKRVKYDEVKQGKFLLTYASYKRGELLLYDAPDFTEDIIVPKIAFFTGKVTFPTLYEGSMPWMSVCPSEINSMKKQMDAAFGKVLVLGCGLGYYQMLVSDKSNVQSVEIIELSPEIAGIFTKEILPFFPNKEKIKVTVANAIDFMETVKCGDYDFVFADIWEGILDGAEHYVKIKPHEKRLADTQFTYWIEDQIKYYLSGE